MNAPLLTLGLVALLTGLGTTAPAPQGDPQPGRRHDSPPFSFVRHYVETKYGGNGRPGWVRAGDVDLDGDIDFVAGGGNALFVYLNGGGGKSWSRTESVDGTKMMGANAGVLIDVDRDGDLDVISALYYRELGWWENPGAENISVAWTYRPIAAEKWFLHDLVIADIDGDGQAREIVTNLMNKGMKAKSRIIGFAIPDDVSQKWAPFVVQPGHDHGNDNHAGLDTGDIDGDGRPDIAFANGWYRAPTEDGASWAWNEIHKRGGVSNVALRDLNGDSQLDVVTTLGHRSKGVFWYEASKAGASWTEHIVHAQIGMPESLAVVDLDSDGDLDIVTADLDDTAWNREIHNVYAFENPGNAQSWRQHNISPNSHASHLLQVVDVNGDGRLDIVSEACGWSVITYLENVSGR